MCHFTLPEPPRGPPKRKTTQRYVSFCTFPIPPETRISPSRAPIPRNRKESHAGGNPRGVQNDTCLCVFLRFVVLAGAPGGRQKCKMTHILVSKSVSFHTFGAPLRDTKTQNDTHVYVILHIPNSPGNVEFALASAESQETQGIARRRQPARSAE